MREKGHSGETGMTPAKALTPMDILIDIRNELRALRAVDMPADGEDYRDLPLLAGAGDLYLDSDVQFGYAYIPNAPRDMTIYSGTRGGLIGSFKAGAFIQFRMPRSTGVTIAYAAGTAAQTLTVYLSAREIFVNPGTVLVDPGSAALSLGKAEDSPSASGDIGVFSLAIRNDAGLTTLTSADADYSGISVNLKGQIQADVLSATSIGDGALGIAGWDSTGNNNRNLAVAIASFTGTTWDRQRTPNVFKTFALAASSAEQTIWTPTAGKKFRLMGFVLTINTLAATVTFRDNTAGTTIFVTAGPAASIVQPSNLGNGILSAAINNLLTIQASAVSALVGTVWGTEE